MKKLMIAALTLLIFGLTGFNGVMAGRPADKPKPEPEIAETEIICTYEYVDSYWNLWAGQHIYAGEVIISNDDDYIYIDIYADGTGILQEAHVNVYYDPLDIPTSRPAPGLSDFVIENINSNHVQFMIPATIIEGNTFYFIIHVAFAGGSNTDGTPVGGETGYAGGDPGYEGPGAWFYVVEHTIILIEDCIEVPVEDNEETAWVFFGDDSIEIDENRWGWYTMFMTGTFDIYAGAGQNDLSKGTLVGTATVDMYGNVTFDLFEGYELVEYHIYIGNGIPTHQGLGQYEVDPDFMLSTDPVYLAIHLVVDMGE